MAKRTAKQLNEQAVILSQKGKNGQAIKLFEEIIAQYPEYKLARYNLAVVYNNLGKEFREKGDLRSAVGMLRKSILTYSKYGPAYSNVVYLLRQLCDWEAAKAMGKYLDRLTKQALSIGEKSPSSVFLDVMRNDSPRHNWQVAKSWSEEIEKKIKEDRKKLGLKHKWNNDRIKIGYVSDGFRDFPTAHNLLDVFRNHDKNRFEIYAYHHGDDDKSYWDREIKKSVEQFVDINEWTLIRAVKKINADRIDILVDLKGHTDGGNLEIFAHRPAKVNVSWLGFPGTTGANFMDYAIVDQVVAPKKNEKYWTEKLLFMPDCYRPVDTATKIRIKNSELRIKKKANKRIIFSSFNNLYKIEPVIWKAWMEILKAVPGSKLWLWKKNEEAVANLKAQISNYGIDSKRIVFHERVDKPKHLVRVAKADIGLDTRLVNGHTTTADTLRMGVPVIALMGRHMCSRVSASCLMACGMEELVTKDIEEYKKLAIKLAKSKKELTKVKNKLKTNLVSSPLLDTKLFTHNLEELLISAYEDKRKKR